MTKYVPCLPTAEVETLHIAYELEQQGDVLWLRESDGEYLLGLRQDEESGKIQAFVCWAKGDRYNVDEEGDLYVEAE